MRLLIGVETPSLVGGVQTYLRALIPRLRERGHVVALGYRRRPDGGTPSLLSDEIDHPLALGGARAEDVLDWAREWRPDVFFDNGLGSLAQQSMFAAQLPTVVVAHDYVGACISGTKQFRRPFREPCGKVLSSACLLRYLPRGCGGANPLTAIRRFGTERARQKYLREAAALVVLSEHMRREYLAHGFRPETTHLVAPFSPELGPGTPPMHHGRLPTRLLFLGRLTELKGADLLVRALPEASRRLKRDLSLAVAGEGPERARLEELGARLGAKVQFLGWVDASRRAELLRETDLLVLPSVWPEPFGLVGLEAAEYSIPCVAFGVGGIPDWLRPGENGELAPERPTVEGLVEALVRALRGPEHFEKLRAGARRTLENYSSARHLEGLERVLRHATARSSISADSAPPSRGRP